jgi:hypothetical protein
MPWSRWSRRICFPRYEMAGNEGSAFDLPQQCWQNQLFTGLSNTVFKEPGMLGWMILFALMTILGTVMTLYTPETAPATAGLVFALLFVVGLLTRFVRGQA